jgi:hypothetical protein
MGCKNQRSYNRSRVFVVVDLHAVSMGYGIQKMYNEVLFVFFLHEFNMGYEK